MRFVGSGSRADQKTCHKVENLAVGDLLFFFRDI